MLRSVALLCLLVGLSPDLGRSEWTGRPSPHDSASLLVLKPQDFLAADGAACKLEPYAAAPFAGQALRVTAPVELRFMVQEKGAYSFWLRVGAPAKAEALSVTLWRGKKKLLSTLSNDGPGSETQGGPAGYEAYLQQAQSAAPGGGDDGEPNIDGDVDDLLESVREEASELEAEISGGAREDDPSRYVTLDRLEEPDPGYPLYWWKAGEIVLSPGEHVLRLAPAAAAEGQRAPLVDAGLLTTAESLIYPFAGDISAPRASYVRFRLDSLPEEGLALTATLRIHFEPWGTGTVHFNPQALSSTKSERHSALGYTRWYRLQDIEYGPPLGAGETQLHLRLNGQDQADGRRVAGATQFAVFPHQDYVLREIPWQEPDGLNVTFSPDFERHLHLLRTVRDQAREDYDRARGVTAGRIYPLTRGGLYLGTGGNATGEAHEYMVKTLRLLGMNAVSDADPIRSRELYGWSSSAGHYWPEVHLPFDEEQARQQYDADYREYFTAQRELYEKVSVFQVADEPSEISRAELSAPLWRFQTGEEGSRWLDVTGGSDLTTRRCNLSNCVLEGEIAQLGAWIGFRAAVDDALAPQGYVYWHIGAVSVNREVNLAVGRVGLGAKDEAGVTRRSAVAGAAGVPFKIVYDGAQAALYLNGKLVHQHSDLPEQGGLGFTGGVKEIKALRLRPILERERLGGTSPDDLADAVEPSVLDLDADELLAESEELPDWAEEKPLEEMVREEFVPSGGVPGAHDAFRTWAARQGLSPQTFGYEAWEDVRPLTVAELVQSPADARLFYYSRRFSGWLTARMFGLASEAIRRHAPNPQMLNFVALSGHSLYFPSEQPLDMFALAADTPAMMPGVSDWMSYGSWRWDSHQAVAFSVAPYNAGARRYGQEPITWPMMHCVYPNELRGYTMLANNVRHISYWTYGPQYAMTEGYWSQDEGCHRATHRINNRAGQADDLLATARQRPSRVAMLYSHANEYWRPQSSFADKRAAFLALSHEYYQPELVTEQQVGDGALNHYDALFALDPLTSSNAQTHIADWVRAGGLLWTCADALTANEFNEPADLLAEMDVCRRTLGQPAAGAEAAALHFEPADGQTPFRPHTVLTSGLPESVQPAAGAKLLGQYANDRPAWFQQDVGQGRVVYLAHRAGLTYTSKAARLPGYEAMWADCGRDMLVRPLREANVPRELTLSEPLVMAAPMSCDAGTVVVLYNMRPVPLAGVELTLAEPERPASVEWFVDMELAPLPFEWKAGRVRVELPLLDGSQMVVIRRRPAPADHRPADMLAQARFQLASTDWRAQSAGAFFAAGLPDVQAESELLPLLESSQWQVRQAAAEALARAASAASALALQDRAEREPDAHVLGDLLTALARQEAPQTAALCELHLASETPWLRRQAVHAVRLLPQASAQLIDRAGELATADNDLRVRQAAMELLAQRRPETAVRIASSLLASAGTPPEDRAAWVAALTEHPAAADLAAAGAARLPTDLLLPLSAQFADPRLAAALSDAVADLTEEQAFSFVAAAIRQRDRKLASGLLEKRRRLHPTVAAYLPLILEYAFDARLGNVMEDWLHELSGR